MFDSPPISTKRFIYCFVHTSESRKSWGENYRFQMPFLLMVIKQEIKHHHCRVLHPETFNHDPLSGYVAEWLEGPICILSE